jgi:hypothetical protein
MPSAEQLEVGHVVCATRGEVDDVVNIGSSVIAALGQS